MMATVQVGCYSAFSVCMQSVFWNNTERTSDGNGDGLVIGAVKPKHL